MGRPQKFSEDEALDRAMELFWEQGFHATSLSELVERTGVCRASLYKTFGGKEELYNRALQRYRQVAALTYAPFPVEGESVLAFLRALFRAKVHEVTEQRPEGCMFLNATTELITKDARIREAVVENEAAQRAWLRKLLETGRAAGEFSPSLDTARVAHYLFAALQGITVNAMSQTQGEELYPVIDTALSVLE